MLTLDVCLQCRLLPKRLVTGRVLCAVELRFVNILVSLKSTGRREGLPAAFPIAHMGSLVVRTRMGVPQVPLEVVFPWEGFVAACFGTNKGPFLVVAAHV
jgi:hypothetical protein